MQMWHKNLSSPTRKPPPSHRARTPQKTPTRLPEPPFFPGCGCFSAYTYVSALRRYQACLMQWSCISISAGQTQINRNVLKKKMFQTNFFASQAERERARVEHTNEPISFTWKGTKTFVTKTPRPKRSCCIDAFWFLIFYFLQALGLSHLCC